MRIDGPSLAERSRVGCKDQRSAEYRAYSSERRRKRVGGVELGSAMPVAGGLEPFQGSNPADDLAPPARRCGGYAQQAPSFPICSTATWNLSEGNVGWPVHSYVRTSNVNSATMNVMAFMNDLVTRGRIPSLRYVTGVQAGIEIRTGGGTLTTNSFYCRIE